LIKHNAVLQDKILDRLRNKEQFQGARFELCVTAAMIVAGFSIDYEDETDSTQPHGEFVASHPSGLVASVEAKSRHRDGVLGFTSRHRNARARGPTEHTKVGVEVALRQALEKKLLPRPYLIFIEVNLPGTEELREDSGWFQELSDAVQALTRECPAGTFPANAIYFYNDAGPHHLDEIPPGPAYWCYKFIIEDSQFPLPDPSVLDQIEVALLQRANVPSYFPEYKSPK
jgi:hypothetical protein